MTAPVTILDAQLSPEILADQRVTFRLTARKATEVKALGQFGDEVILTKGEKGLWTGSTTKPVSAGVYEYSFAVDGLRIMDPRNPMIKPQRWPGSSILHIPASPPALWDMQDISHGTIHHHDYRSKALDGKWRHLVVYTPPNIDGPLPVLYLAHGYSDQERTWTEHGKAHSILDALISQKQAVPMIIVMPDAHSLPPEGEFDIYGPKNSEAFCNELVQDVIPFIESHYQVVKDSNSRAFAGLSMGGHHALTIALQYHEHFAQIGAFSAAIPSEATTTSAV